ncbi:MAG: 50S ribosomal protein L9 [Eubacterium sp.]|nr:50S ribosomal protein L9 [Eubacterium sp.]
MIVILNRDVKGSGKAGEVVKVNDGYARNFLIPKGYAIEASQGNVRSLEKARQKQAEEAAAQKAAAEELANKLSLITVTIKTKAGEGGRLFGSITSKDIGEALIEQYDIHIDKKKIQIPQPIKMLGKTSVNVKLHSEVSAQLTVEVTD